MKYSNFKRKSEIIFGNIFYESMSALDENVVILNDIHIDIMDYISLATCPDTTFRNMWVEFEWENKVNQTIILHGKINVNVVNELA